MSSYAYFNGVFDKKEKINIPLSDRSIFFGDAVYDAMIGSYDRILWEDEHIERLLSNANKIEISHGYTHFFLSSLFREIAVKSGLMSYFMYCQISRNSMTRTHSAIACNTNLMVTIEPIEINEKTEPLKLLTTEDLRHGYCDIKTINLLPAVLSASEAEKAGFDEAIFIKDGFVTECTKSNIHILKQGRIVTHPKNRSILPGITREHLLDVCKREKIPYEERPFSVDEMMGADEILVSSTTKLLKTANNIDGRYVGGNDSDLAQKLSHLMYNEYREFCLI